MVQYGKVWYAPASVRSLSGTDVPFLCSSCRPSSVTFTNTGPSFFAAGDSTSPLSGHATNSARTTLKIPTVNLGDKKFQIINKNGNNQDVA